MFSKTFVSLFFLILMSFYFLFLNKQNNSKNICYLINESSSTKTAFFLYNSDLKPISFSPNNKYVLSNTIRNYAEKDDADGFYNIIRNKIVENKILRSNCDEVQWSILSTGGMRDLEDKKGYKIIQKFYSNIEDKFASNPHICHDKVCKKISLTEIRTISADEEGYYAWKGLKQTGIEDSLIVFDIGGQTGQLTNKNGVIYTDYLGRNRSMEYLGKSIKSCLSNDKNYNGKKCRAEISSYINNTFNQPFPELNSDHIPFYAVSNFYYFFEDVCEKYMPFINENKIKIKSNIRDIVESSCKAKSSKTGNIILKISDYRDISDELCKYWGNWGGLEGKSASETCYTGNYNYEMLKALSLSDNHTIFVSREDWAKGAVIDVHSAKLFYPTAWIKPFSRE